MTLINFIAVAAYVASIILVLSRFREYLVFFAYLSFIQVWALVSCFYNDLGIYNIELARFTMPTFATARLAALYIIFNVGFWLAASLLDRRPLIRVDYSLSREPLNFGNLRLFLYVGVALLIIYVAYSLTRQGAPLFTGMDRRTFFAEAGPLERALIVHSYLIAFVLGYFQWTPGWRLLSRLLFLLYILFAVLIGNKFSALIGLAIPYFAPLYSRTIAAQPQLKILRWRYALVVIVALAVMGGFAFSVYATASGNVSLAFNYLVNRVLVFEGEIWWAAHHDIMAYGMYDSEHWRVELDNLTDSHPAEEGAVGMKYLMVKILGPERAYQIFDIGYLYTMAYPAILIAMFPLAIVALVQFLAGVGLCLLLYYLHYSILFGHGLRALVTILMIVPFITVLFTGNFEVFFTLGMMIKMAILVLLELGAALRPRPEAA